MQKANPLCKKILSYVKKQVIVKEKHSFAICDSSKHSKHCLTFERSISQHLSCLFAQAIVIFFYKNRPQMFDAFYNNNDFSKISPVTRRCNTKTVD